MADGTTYYDRQEVRNAAERELALFHALPGLIRHAIDNAPYYRTVLDGIEPDDIVSREALASLPLLRRRDLSALQQSNLPFGGLNATPANRLARMFGAPGPIFQPEGNRSDYWRLARALYAAGFRAGDTVLNCFSYHLDPRGFMADQGARALGCAVIPGGHDDLAALGRVLRDIAPGAYVGTADVLHRLLDAESGQGSIRRALVADTPLDPAATATLRERGVEAFACYTCADLGLIAYETSAREGLVVDESIILEIVDPKTGEPLVPGEAGEIVVSVFNPDYPLIRFATGDTAAILPGASPCGRTNMRIDLPRNPRD